MNNLLCLLVSALLFVWSSCTSAKPGQPATPKAASEKPQASNSILIGSWNLEWFGGPASMRSVHLEGGKRKELPPRNEQDITKMAAFVRDLGVSVLAVQEIGNEDDLRKLAKQIGPHWGVVLGTTGGGSEGRAQQAIGFCYDEDRVELLWAEEMLDFPRQRDGLPIYHRVPVTACFRETSTGLDFRAVVLHLKAGDKTDDRKKRKLEAEGIRDWLITLQSTDGEDQDIVVLGDFNSSYGTDVQTTLEQSGVARYLPQPRAEPTIMHFDDPIDQIAPSPRFLEVMPETFDAHGEAVGADKEAWRKTYSDHYPVTVCLQNEPDDDPDSAFSRGNPEHRLPVAARPQAKGPANKRSQPARTQGEEAIAPGTAVRVRVQEGASILEVEGTLISDLGEWVQIRDLKGEVRAFPKTSVREVLRR
jgi:endonuclease/exonuclease/phosphatase family metal-dependent hydrolase